MRTPRWRYAERDGGKQGAEVCDHDADSERATVVAELMALVGKSWPERVTSGHAEAGSEKKRLKATWVIRGQP